MTSTFAGKTVTTEQIRATVAELTYYRAFLRSDPARYKRCRDLTNDHRGYEMDRSQCRAWLGYLVNTAINRKAGIPDTKGRKQESDWQWAARRDQRKLHDKIRHHVRVYQWETRKVRERFSHLLADRDDD